MFSALSAALSNQLTRWSHHTRVGVTWEAPCCFTVPVSIWFLGSGNFLLVYAMCELKPLLLPCLFFTMLQPFTLRAQSLITSCGSVYSPKIEGYVKKMWTWNKTGIFFQWILISKPNLENISAVLNVTAGISLIFWLTKILCHLHKNYSHLASNSFTQVISLPFHAIYYRNTKLMNSCSCQ